MHLEMFLDEFLEFKKRENFIDCNLLYKHANEEYYFCTLTEGVKIVKVIIYQL